MKVWHEGSPKWVNKSEGSLAEEKAARLGLHAKKVPGVSKKSMV